MTALESPSTVHNTQHWHAAFLSVLPCLQNVARRHFRHLVCHDRRADAVAEATAIAWKWFVRLKERGRDPESFPVSFATLAARAVRSGRRLCGRGRAKDAVSAHDQSHRGCFVSSSTLSSDMVGNGFEEALRDNWRTPVPEQVRFRIDFPAWLATLSERDREVLEGMAMGHRTLDLAVQFGLTPGRISQLRLAFMRGWHVFSDGQSQQARGV